MDRFSSRNKTLSVTQVSCVGSTPDLTLYFDICLWYRTAENRQQINHQSNRPISNQSISNRPSRWHRSTVGHTKPTTWQKFATGKGQENTERNQSAPFTATHLLLGKIHQSLRLVDQFTPRFSSSAFCPLWCLQLVARLLQQCERTFVSAQMHQIGLDSKDHFQAITNNEPRTSCFEFPRGYNTSGHQDVGRGRQPTQDTSEF